MLKVEGSFETSGGQIFDTVTYGHGQSKVYLIGVRITEVRPEWWGAAGDGSSDDTWALQEALDAGYNYRTMTLPDGTSPPLDGPPTFPPLPIVLTGSYLISKTLEVGVRTGTPPVPFTQVFNAVSGFFLRGCRGNGLRAIAPSLRAAASDSPIESILHVKGSFGFTIDGLGFDANAAASTCVHVEVTTASQGNLIHGCSFRGATEHQILIGPNVLPLMVRKTRGGENVIPVLVAPHGTQLAGDFCALGIERCLIVVDSPACNGVVLRASQALAMRFQQCHFRGVAAAMIRMYSGTALIDSCNFHNSAMPNAVPDAVNPNDPTGVDLFLARELPVFPVDASTVLYDPSSQPVAQTIPGGLTVVHSVSQSARFLQTFSASADLFYRRVAPDYNVVMISVRHQPSLLSSLIGSARDVTMPSVYWDLGLADVDGTAGSSLTTIRTPTLALIGCRLDGGVVIGPSGGVVTDIGNSFGPYSSPSSIVAASEGAGMPGIPGPVYLQQLEPAS